MRTHFSQLPSIAETEEILKKEAKRALVPSKFDKHYTDFSTVIEWLKEVGLETKIFEEELSWQEIVATGEEMKTELVKKTIGMIGNSIVDKINEYISGPNNSEKSDVILVFGGKDIRRAQLGAELWKKGVADIVFIAGGSPNYTQWFDKPEALAFKDEMVKMGVPEEKILTEIKSITIPDNVRSALNTMDELKIGYNKITYVVAWYATRRVWVHLMKYGPEKIKANGTSLLVVNPELSEDGWFNNEMGIKTIFGEFVKMKMATVLNTA